MLEERRINPTIGPSDLEWEKVHAAFDYFYRTSDKTLGDILLESFTVQEIRLFYPQERSDLKALQEQNSLRYHSLLAERFIGVSDEVPTKLAMMYFGLPIEPVRTVLKAQENNALTQMEAEIAELKPLAFVANDELSQVTFGAPVRDERNKERSTDAMDIDNATDQHASEIPVTSKSVLTVQEQANLLQAFKTMRDIVVKRAFPCPFDGCKYLFDPSRPEDAKTHIARLHVSKKCIWCNETHFEWWNEDQRKRHLRHMHRDKLLATIGVTDLKIVSNDSAANVVVALTQRGSVVGEVVPASSDNAPIRHAVEFFCDSCGRDNRNFTSAYEKQYHERVCRTAGFGAKDQAFCVDCGDYSTTTDDGRPCGHPADRVIGQFCILCGIDTHLLAQFGDLHRSSCRGQGSTARPFCPYCGDRLCSDDETCDRDATIIAHRAQCNSTAKIQVFAENLEQLPFNEPDPSPAVLSPASSEEYHPDDVPSDSESERGRPQKRQRKGAVRERRAAKSPKRRPDSPNWNQVLGDPDPSFVPDNKYYCSKCLRRIPKVNRRRNGKQTTDIGEEYKHHIAHDRCCRIRNGVGSADNLPNRSGWIPAGKVSKLGALKSKFLDSHPDYKATLYPLMQSDARTNMWRSDPNNESNSTNWHLPWPPYIGYLPSISEDIGDSDTTNFSPTSAGPDFESEEGSGARKKGGKKRRRDQDGGYSYESDTDSDDGLAGDDENWSSNKKKRRRMADGTYRPSRGDESDSDNDLTEGGPERLEKVRQEMEQEMQSMTERIDNSQIRMPTSKEGLDSFIAEDDVVGS